MSNTPFLPCDGCGQPASQDHLARRLQRLEWSTRYRPIHIQSLLLGSFAPAEDSAFLYSEALRVAGEALQLLNALRIPWEGKPAESFLGEFQRRGLFMTHVLECPLEPANQSASQVQTLLAKHLPLATARIRRSLKPKQVALIGLELLPLVGELTESALGCPVVLHSNKPFQMMRKEGDSDIIALRLAVERARSSSL
jgi:hypothetical protein